MAFMIGEFNIEIFPNAACNKVAIDFSVDAVPGVIGPDCSDFVRDRVELAQFAAEVGLVAELFDHEGTIGWDRGVRLITRSLVDAVNSAFDAIKTRNGLLPEKHVKAFKWLHFWINWAFENCETPVIVYRK